MASSRTDERVTTFNRLVGPHLKGRINSYLDVGCGDMSITRLLAEELEIDAGQYAGVDIFPSDQDYYIQTDGKTIDIEDESIELVTAFVAFHHFEYFPQMLSELYRIMTPGAILYFREHDATPEEYPFLDFVHLIESMSRNLTNMAEFNTYFARFFTQEEFHNLLVSLGFERLSTHSYPVEKNPQLLYHSAYRLIKKQSLSIKEDPWKMKWGKSTIDLGWLRGRERNAEMVIREARRLFTKPKLPDKFFYYYNKKILKPLAPMNRKKVESWLRKRNALDDS